MTLIVVPSESIAKQFYGQLVDAFGSNRVGYFGGGKHSIKDITVGIANSVNNHIEEFKKENLGLIIHDEMHHQAATTFYSISEKLADVGQMFGLTATDFRSDGLDILIHAGCGETLINYDVKWGIDHNFLAKPFFIIKKVNTIVFNSDDKLKNYRSHVLHSSIMKEEIFKTTFNFLNAGKKVLVLVDAIEHGKELSSLLGVPFAFGEDKDSNEYIKAFNDGKVNCLVGGDNKIGEGVDTRPVEVLILANFIASKGSVLQCIGRGLRRTDNKDKCIIVDFIPEGSKMLKRHAEGRIKIYKEITDSIKIL